MIDKIKVGDVLTVKGTGYLSNFIRKYTVTRLTKKYIICGYHKITADGVLMPRDKYINHTVTHINEEPV